MLSETCKDLLKRLLQRNPNDRISFEQFFAHPFIDLEHMPSADSIKKAVCLNLINNHSMNQYYVNYRQNY